jgi:hypothetical protein
MLGITESKAEALADSRFIAYWLLGKSFIELTRGAAVTPTSMDLLERKSNNT